MRARFAKGIRFLVEHFLSREPPVLQAPPGLTAIIIVAATSTGSTIVGCSA